MPDESVNDVRPVREPWTPQTKVSLALVVLIVGLIGPWLDWQFIWQGSVNAKLETIATQLGVTKDVEALKAKSEVLWAQHLRRNIRSNAPKK